jgi:hypothetical protein
MRVVQALHWLKDTLPVDGDRVRARLQSILTDPKHGKSIAFDLAQGFAHLPTWMQEFLRSVPAFDPGLADTLSPRDFGGFGQAPVAPVKGDADGGPR